jgi:hypothetical protein
MQKHIQELINELNTQNFDWTDNELIVKENQVILVNHKANHIIEYYTLTKNKNNTFTCHYKFNNTTGPTTTRNTIEQLVDYIMEF